MADALPTMIESRAYAKINLGLRVLRKRDDGYHDIETIFHRIDLYDTITIERAATIQFRSDDPSLPQGDDNLCVKAAKLLCAAAGTQHGARIRLSKRIPVGAGLGGGSSDASSTLRALVKLWNLAISDTELAEIALQLGSDVPYFLRHDSAYATGRGEKLKYFRLDFPCWILVVYPDIHISTAWAYQQIVPNEHSSELNLKESLLEFYDKPDKLRSILRNDFESPVFNVYPELQSVKHAMEQAGAFVAQLSGSGSALYALFQKQDGAEKAEHLLQSRYRTFLTPPSFRVDVL